MTRLAKRFLENIKVYGQKSLIVDDVRNGYLRRSVQNLARHNFLPPVGLNVYDILRHDCLVMSQEAVQAVIKRCSERVATGSV